MKKIFLFLLLTLGSTLSNSSFAQSYPQFNITAYDSLQSSGYYFFCPYSFSGIPFFPPGTQHQMILDKEGNVVYFREVSGYFAGDFKIQPNGLMSFCGEGKFYLMDSTFTIVDSVKSANGVEFDLHDLKILPNGHFLVLGNEDVTMDLSSYNLFLHNGTPGSSNAVVRAFVVQELDSNKNVVFEWHSKDHFAFDDVDEFWLNDVDNVDWTHVNAVEMDTDGNLLISSRHFDEITKISRSDSSIIWRLGGKRNQFTFIGDSSMFLSQHDCRRLPNGNITLFDNGRALTPIHKASAKEYTLDEVNHIATLVWSHSEGPNIWSRSQGNMQRLANGNTLTSYGNLVSPPIVFNVVDSLENKIFEIVFPDSQLTYRSFNFLTLPWEFKRPQISCSFDASQYFLTADSGYSQYLWSTGATTQSIPVSSVGNYTVFVPIGEGGYISSEKIVVTDTANLCNALYVDQLFSRNDFIIYPNPAIDHLTISSAKNISVNYEIIDIIGRKLLSGKTNSDIKTDIDISSLSSGIYSIRLGTLSHMFIKD